MQYLFGFFSLFLVLSIGVSLVKSEPILIISAPATPTSALFAVLTAAFFWTAVPYFWTQHVRSFRFVMANKRALIYRPIWGSRFALRNSDGLRLERVRDYTDPEYSPITGGYFTQETSIERWGPEDFGYIKIANLYSQMDDAGGIRVIKNLMPFLDDIIFDTANLVYAEVEGPKMAERHLNDILRRWKAGQT